MSTMMMMIMSKTHSFPHGRTTRRRRGGGGRCSRRRRSEARHDRKNISSSSSSSSPRVFYAVVVLAEGRPLLFRRYISNFFVGIKWTRNLEEVFWRAFFIYGTLRKRARAYYMQTCSSVWCSWDSRAAGERYHASPRCSKNKSYYSYSIFVWGR